MRALEALTKARLQGAKPSVVMVTLANAEQFHWWREGSTVEVVIPDAEPVARLDFRPLVGCDVVVIAKDHSERTRLAVERICAQALRLTLLVGFDPDNLGHVWERDRGWRKFGKEAA